MTSGCARNGVKAEGRVSVCGVANPEAGEKRFARSQHDQRSPAKRGRSKSGWEWRAGTGEWKRRPTEHVERGGDGASRALQPRCEDREVLGAGSSAGSGSLSPQAQKHPKRVKRGRASLSRPTSEGASGPRIRRHASMVPRTHARKPEAAWERATNVDRRRPRH